MMRLIVVLSLLLACSNQATPSVTETVSSAKSLMAASPAGEAPASQAASTPASIPASAPMSTSTSAPTSAPVAPYPGVAIDPSWKKEVYVMTDSVVLGAKIQLEKGLKNAGYEMILDGRPAIMLPWANKEIKKRTTLPEIAVVAIGYNTLWEKDRRNFAKWAKRFDTQAEEVYKTLTDRGVKKIVWVLLREISEENIPMKHSGARRQLEKAGFYFPYVNERLKAMRERHPEMALADWPGGAAKIGYTYDAIHVNPKGGWKMTDEIMVAIGLEPPPQELKEKKKPTP